MRRGLSVTRGFRRATGGLGRARLSTRRHRHGQPVRLADHAARRRNARHPQDRLRGADRLGPPHARSGCTSSPTGAKADGFKVIIAGAGGAAHLPGMIAALTTLPVFGVPVQTKALERRRTACFPSSRCRPASRSARSPSARPARPMPRCSPPPSWRCQTTEIAARLEAYRAAQTAAVPLFPSRR